MSIIKAFREESEVIKFDNLFTRDLEDEQQFDLVFAAEQDDEDLKTIAGNKIMRENGEEKEFDLPDCVYVNEDGEVKDKDDEVEDISSNDADSDGVDDDIEAASDNPTAAAPSVVVNVDADDVNINAGNGGTSLEGTEDEEVKEDASVTVNAKVVNMTTNVDPANDDEVKAPSTEPATTPVPAEGPSDDEPIEPVGDVDIDSDDNTPAEPESSEADVEECSDNTGTTPGTNDDGAPMGEGVEQIMTSSQLEDILNTGLDVAPAYEGGHFSDSPEDKSTEVVFSNSNDKEVREAAEPTKNDVVKEAKEPTKNDTVVKEEIEAVKNDDNLDNSKKIEGEFEDDLAPITDGDIEKILNNAPEDETKKDEGIDPVKPSDVPMNDGSAHEAAEPTKNDIEFIKEEDTDILDSDDIDMDNNCDISPVGPTKVIPDEVNAPVGDMNYDKEDALMKEGSDFMDQVNAIDNGDSFADTMNTGLNISPEEVLPGSDEELIDDEAIAFIEGE